METKFCKYCGEKIDKEAVICPKCGRQLQEIKKEEKNQQNKEKKEPNSKTKFYEKTWFMWIMLVFFTPVGIFLMWKFHNEMKKNIKVIITILFSFFFLLIITNDNEEKTNNEQKDNNLSTNEIIKKKINIIDFSNMKEYEILNWCKNNNLTCNFKREYSDTITKDNFIKQSINAGEQTEENSTIIITFSLGKEPTTEQKNALKKAESYANLMHMSKAKIYDQLTSEYGEGFDKDAAQYAIDNIECDWNSNALSKAKSYRDTMNMSKNRIYDQLISEYGEKFTKEEAQYAIDHLDD